MISRWSDFRCRHVGSNLTLVIMIGASLITRTVVACNVFV